MAAAFFFDMAAQHSSPLKKGFERGRDGFRVGTRRETAGGLEGRRGSRNEVPARKTRVRAE
jgi:hypothetical protein